MPITAAPSVTEASLTWTGSCVNRFVPAAGDSAAEAGGDPDVDREMLPVAPVSPEPELGLGLELAELSTTRPAMASRATRNRRPAHRTIPVPAAPRSRHHDRGLGRHHRAAALRELPARRVASRPVLLAGRPLGVPPGRPVFLAHVKVSSQLRPMAVTMGEPLPQRLL